MESPANQAMSIRERVLSILDGRRPDRLPLIDRLEVWYSAHQRAGTLPASFDGLSLTEVHRAIGFGQQRFVVPFGLQLRGVEVVSRFNGETTFHEYEPFIKEFPGMWDLVSMDQAGTTVTELITPVGKVWVQQELHPHGVATGTTPYLRVHLIKGESDFEVVEYILEKAEFVPAYQDVFQEEEEIGGIGFVVPLVPRIPFQQLLLEYLGEETFIMALHDGDSRVKRLMTLIHEQTLASLNQLVEFSAAYVEFGDNLHGLMTSPRLFTRYCLPAFQQYSEILHGQGKKVGSHVDGELRPLLKLLSESGLDVCESISPAPLTSCEFDEIWEAWQQGPIIWGGIPSPILEDRTSEQDFRDYLDRLLETVGNGRIILGVGDLVMGINKIERVRTIVEAVEAHPLAT